MNMKRHFLKEDIEQARREINCIGKCIALVQAHIDHGNFEMAQDRAVDLMKSLSEIRRLALKKKDSEVKVG